MKDIEVIEQNGKVRSIKSKYGYVIFGDCVSILKTWDSIKIDTCLSDPPWIVDYNQKNRKHHGRMLRYDTKIHYADKYDFEWVNSWFDELMRICNCVILNLSPSNFIEWIRKINHEPIGMAVRWFKNGQNGTKVANANGYYPYVFYGKLPSRLKFDIMYRTKSWGFLNKDKDIIKHPTPKDANIYKKILEETKSKNVLDPFMGSGTTAEACEMLGIKYVGIEINQEYANDIVYKMARGIRYYKDHQSKKLKSVSDY